MRNILLFTFFLVIISCETHTSKPSDENAPIALRINLNATSEPELKISIVVDSVEFIKLETTDRCIVG